MRLALVLGTAREGREAERVAHAIQAVLSALPDLTVELVDVRDHVKTAQTVPAWAPLPERAAWKEIAASADAFMLVVPEYNHGYPGELKLLLDSLTEEYRDKPVGLIGVSNGPFGGARVVDHIKPVLIELRLVPTKEAVLVRDVADAVDEVGRFVDERTMQAVATLAEALRNRMHT